MLLEICIDDEAGLRTAIAGGADRIELCAALTAGGLTPSVGFMRWACTNAAVPVMVMIRPHDYGFAFSENEVDAMLIDIEMAKAAGAAGVVIGCLTPDKAIDVAATERLLAAAGGSSVTFHRAFDLTPDPLVALDTLIELGIDRVLTSGQARTVGDGRTLIERLIEHAAGRIVVMPGGGLLGMRTAELIASLSAAEFHASASRDRSLFNTLEQVTGGVIMRRRTDLERVRMLRGWLDASG